MTMAWTSIFVGFIRSKRLSAFELLAKIVLCSVFAGMLYISNRIDLLVGGSDATSFLIAPMPVVQAAEIFLAAVCLLTPANPRWRIVLALPAFIFFALATHRLLIDGNHGEVRDIYALSTVQHLQFDPGQEGGFHVRAYLMSIVLRPTGDAGIVQIITPPVLGLDRSRLALINN